MNPARLTILLAFLPLACGPAPVDGPPPPGTVKVLAIEPVEAVAEANLIPNGELLEWHAGLGAPTGFLAPVPDGGSTVARGAKAGYLDTAGYTARQAWTRSDGDLPPDSGFGVMLELEAQRTYVFEAVARPEAGAAAMVSAWERGDDGAWRALARPVVVVQGDAPLRAVGAFTTEQGGPVVLTSRWAGAGTPTGTVHWGAWRLRPMPPAEPVPDIAIDPIARHALARETLDRVRAQIDLYGGLPQWDQALAENRQTVARVLREAGDGAASVAGYDGYVFGRDELEPLAHRKATAEPTEGVRAILRAEHRLAARGVRLIVVPVPDRVALLLDRLNRQAAERPVHLADHAARVVLLAARDVLVLDPALHLRERLATGASIFAQTDTEPTSLWVASLAGIIAPTLRAVADLPEGDPGRFTIVPESIPAPQALLGGLPPHIRQGMASENEEVLTVRAADGAPLALEAPSPVLAVGSLAVLHHLRGASLAAHLTHALGFPVAVQQRVLPDRELAAWLAGDAPELAAAKVVVLCLPSSALAESGWRPVP